MRVRYEALDCPEVLPLLPREVPPAMFQIGAAFRVREQFAGLPEKTTHVVVASVIYDGSVDEMILVVTKDARRTA